MPIIVATAVLHNIARRNNNAVPDVDPELDLPVPWDEMLAACNVNINDRNEINGAATRTEIIHNYFAKYVSIRFYIKVTL